MDSIPGYLASLCVSLIWSALRPGSSRPSLGRPGHTGQGCSGILGGLSYGGQTLHLPDARHHRHHSLKPAVAGVVRAGRLDREDRAGGLGAATPGHGAGRLANPISDRPEQFRICKRWTGALDQSLNILPLRRKSQKRKSGQHVSSTCLNILSGCVLSQRGGEIVH